MKIGAAALRVEETGEEPGMVRVADGNRLIVATGSGTLELLSVQLPGKKMLSVAEFLRGFSWPANARLGCLGD
jgi:methionyl-tRNA formyltransferase